MVNYVRPRNYFLILACLSVFLVNVFTTIQFSLDKNSKDDQSDLRSIIFGSQAFVCIYSLIGFVYLLICVHLRSYNYNTKTWNGLEMKIFGALIIVFFLLGVIATVMHMDRFSHFGAVLFLASFVSLTMFVVVWKREHNIKAFVERVLHANSLSNSFITEQDARDLFKLREYDKDFATHIQGYSISNERLVTTTICHVEYYQYQKWLNSLSNVIERKAELDTLHDLHKEITRRSELFGLNAKHKHRYQQLAAMSHLIMPVEENDKQLNRDTSFFMHNGNPSTTV